MSVISVTRTDLIPIQTLITVGETVTVSDPTHGLIEVTADTAMGGAIIYQAPSQAKSWSEPSVTSPEAKPTGSTSSDEAAKEASQSLDDGAASRTLTTRPTDEKATSVPTSTSEPTAAPAQDVKYKGLSDGAVAGVAIACIVAGIALGALAVFLLFRRRRRQPQTNFNQVSNGGIEPKNEVMVAVTPSKSDVDLNQFLLDAIPDKQIEGELHALSELLYQHAESHYHRSPVHLDAQTLAQSLVHIGYSPAASGLDAMTVVALCLEPSSRPVGLRHVLSHVIFSSLDFSSGSNMAMLPPVVRDFLSTIPSAESNNGTAPATSLALSKWRSLSTLLLHPTPADRTPLPVPVAEASQQAGSLANELNSFLRFFAPQDAAGSQAQTSHLQDVILECTKLGYILLSQPSDWRFVFSDKQSRRVVVCPGLEKLSHSDGTRYRSPREVVAVVTMPV
ncbi:hypothetical protein CDV31_014697 [Fusarium ambrosium]|uniref:Uncharacterized protein n=1 Tax=Fusarium ambrosium TaxID=131363 RepID=A0A428SUP2_9HYPO|nr:hypothetical protein CDV31_014697 [Fusarium ambrosium]